jgi:hypothetical protein
MNAGTGLGQLTSFDWRRLETIVAEAVRFALRSRGMHAMKRSLREKLRRLGRA